MENKKTATPLWEKLVGALGLVLLCCGFIYLTWAEVSADESPLHIVFAIDKITEINTHYLVTVDVENTSHKSAAALQVEGVLVAKGLEVETSSAQVDFLPSSSMRTINFFFKKDPRSGTLEFRASSYQEP